MSQFRAQSLIVLAFPLLNGMPCIGQADKDIFLNIQYSTPVTTSSMGGLKGMVVRQNHGVQNVLLVFNDSHGKINYAKTDIEGCFAFGLLNPGLGVLSINQSIGDIFWPCHWDIQIKAGGFALLDPVEIGYKSPDSLYSGECISGECNRPHYKYIPETLGNYTIGENHVDSPSWTFTMPRRSEDLPWPFNLDLDGNITLSSVSIYNALSFAIGKVIGSENFSFSVMSQYSISKTSIFNDTQQGLGLCFGLQRKISQNITAPYYVEIHIDSFHHSLGARINAESIWLGFKIKDISFGPIISHTTGPIKSDTKAGFFLRFGRL